MRSVAAFACAILMSSQAFAANVANVQGQTLLNVGDGYKQLLGSAEAGAGSNVLANPGGQARVTYEDGCAVTVNPGQVYTIAPVSPCKQATPGWNPYAVGAAVIGGAAAGIIIISSNKSASP